VLARGETNGPVAVTRSAPTVSEMPAELPVVEVAAADSAAAVPATSPAIEPTLAKAVETKSEPMADARTEAKPLATAENAPELPAPAPVADSTPAVRAAVTAWADAWSARNVDAYLAHYAKAFKPASGQTIERWKTQRRDRVGRPDSITVALSDVSISIDGNRAVVKFEQDYRSDDIKVVDRKTLVMVREGQNWKILEEISGS
jgi:ketosteroid isomerase-like protein